jgi:hypothetical protein
VQCISCKKSPGFKFVVFVEFFEFIDFIVLIELTGKMKSEVGMRKWERKNSHTPCPMPATPQPATRNPHRAPRNPPAYLPTFPTSYFYTSAFPGPDRFYIKFLDDASL